MKHIFHLIILLCLASCSESPIQVNISSSNIYGVSYSNNDDFLTYCDSGRYYLYKNSSKNIKFHQKFEMSGAGYSRKYTTLDFSFDDKFVVAVDHDLHARIWEKKIDEYHEFQVISDPKAESRGLPFGAFMFVKFVKQSKYYIVSAHSMQIGVPGDDPQKDVLNLWRLHNGTFKIEQKLTFKNLDRFSFFSSEANKILIGDSDKFYLLELEKDRLQIIKSIDLPKTKHVENRYLNSVVGTWLFNGNKNILVLKQTGELYSYDIESKQNTLVSDIRFFTKHKNLEKLFIQDAILNKRYSMIIARCCIGKCNVLFFIDLKKKKNKVIGPISFEHIEFESMNFNSNEELMAIGYRDKDKSYIKILKVKGIIQKQFKMGF